MKSYLSALLAVFLYSCVPTPSYYSVPPQHRAVTTEPVVGFLDYVESTQLNAEEYFIKDVKGLEGARWRWTLAEPEFRFFLKSITKRVFKLDLGINDRIVRDTGPLRIQILINGELLDEPIFPKPGDTVYEKPVPEKLLKINAENRVLVRVVNPWQAPDPGVRLGFLLHGVGFIGK